MSPPCAEWKSNASKLVISLGQNGPSAKNVTSTWTCFLSVFYCNWIYSGFIHKNATTFLFRNVFQCNRIVVGERLPRSIEKLWYECPLPSPGVSEAQPFQTAMNINWVKGIDLKLKDIQKSNVHAERHTLQDPPIALARPFQDPCQEQPTILAMKKFWQKSSFPLSTMAITTRNPLQKSVTTREQEHAKLTQP